MSILGDLFGGLFGNDDDTAITAEEHPCVNCPSTCALSPGACSVCSPYKEKLADAIYNVEHIEEIRAKYEVVGADVSAEGAGVTCPVCGALSKDPYVCEYCGSRIKEGTGKIQVASYSDIPNPILEAQTIIYDRYKAVTSYLEEKDNDGILGDFLEALSGDTETEETKSLGSKMTEAEIKEAAEHYGVSVADYLTGLDNGKYLTLQGYTKAQSEGNAQASLESLGMGGIGGMAFASLLGTGLYNIGTNSFRDSRKRRPPRDDFRDQRRPPEPEAFRQDRSDRRERDRRTDSNRRVERDRRTGPDSRPPRDNDRSDRNRRRR